MVDAGEDDLFASVATAISTVLGRKLTPEEYEDLKRSLSDPAVLDTLLSRKRTYLIIGSYGTAEREGDERERLELVRDTVERRHPNHRAVLLDDLPTFHPNWVVQFAVVAERDALRTWRTESDLRDLATTAIPGDDVGLRGQ